MGMEKYAQKSNVAGKEPQGKAEENDNRVEESLGSVNKHSSNIGTADSELTPEVGSAAKKKKKKKKKHKSQHLDKVEEKVSEDSSKIEGSSENFEDTLSKKKKKRKHRDLEDEEKAVKEEIVEISLSKKKKRKL